MLLISTPALQASSKACCKLHARRSTTCSLAIGPARTCSEAATQARAALRRFRDAVAAGEAGGLPLRLTVRLPLPSPSSQEDPDALQNYDEGDWPGGILQRFRRLRPLIEEHFLAGYDPQFVGMLESPADGIGVWRAAGGTTTVVSQVGNVNFAPFARLMAGEFGDSVLEPGHTCIVVNPTWTGSKDIGQFWDRKLKQQAANLIDEPAAWLPIYHLWDVRTADGATGLLFRAWPGDWQLYHTSGQPDLAAALEGAEPILVSSEQPLREQQRQLLNAAYKEQREEEKRKKAEAKPKRWL